MARISPAIVRNNKNLSDCDAAERLPNGEALRAQPKRYRRFALLAQSKENRFSVERGGKGRVATAAAALAGRGALRRPPKAWFLLFGG
jgi:hypothetical protein